MANLKDIFLSLAENELLNNALIFSELGISDIARAGTIRCAASRMNDEIAALTKGA